MRNPTLDGSLLLLLLCSPTVATAQVQWLPSAASPRPSARTQHGMASSWGNDTLLFGGQTAVLPYSSETWSWNGSTWTLHQLAVHPPARAGHAMAHDYHRNRVVVFGGWNHTTYLDDTWEYDLVTQAWLPVTTAARPPGRDWAGFCYDAWNQSMLLFGGHDYRATPNKLDDTWAWDGAAWTRLFPATHPAGRFGHSMVGEDPVVFGGAADGLGITNDLWRWQGSTWVPAVTAHSPPARVFHAMAADAPRGRLVVFGGHDANGTLLGDVWEFDGNDWLPRSAPIAPSPREFLTMTRDATDTLLAFGGADQPARAHPLDESWHYGPVWPALVTEFGTACPGSLGQPWLGCGDLAWLGSNYSLQVQGVPPNDLSWIAFGFSDRWTASGMALPLSLASYGAPCTLYVDPAAVKLQPATPAGTYGRAEWIIPLPVAPQLLGVTVFSQAGSFDAGVPGGFSASNACRHQFGSR